MKFSHLFASLLLLFCSVVLLNSCDEDGMDPLVCTDEFVIIDLSVENTEGEPVENAELTITDLSTETELDVCQSDLIDCTNHHANGNYVIFHDGLYDRVSMTGDPYEVSGEKNGTSFTESFVFAKDRCHVFKKSGPDSVTIN